MIAAGLLRYKNFSERFCKNQYMSVFTAVLIILVRIVSVKLLVAFYALPVYSKKEILV